MEFLWASIIERLFVCLCACLPLSPKGRQVGTFERLRDDVIGSQVESSLECAVRVIELLDSSTLCRLRNEMELEHLHWKHENALDLLPRSLSSLLNLLSLYHVWG